MTDVFLTNLRCQPDAGLASQPIHARVGGTLAAAPSPTDCRCIQFSRFTICKIKVKTNEMCQLGVGGISTVVSTNQLKCRVGINGGSKTIARWYMTVKTLKQSSRLRSVFLASSKNTLSKLRPLQLTKAVTTTFYMVTIKLRK